MAAEPDVVKEPIKSAASELRAASTPSKLQPKEEGSAFSILVSSLQVFMDVFCKNCLSDKDNTRSSRGLCTRNSLDNVTYLSRMLLEWWPLGALGAYYTYKRVSAIGRKPPKKQRGMSSVQKLTHLACRYLPGSGALCSPDGASIVRNGYLQGMLHFQDTAMCVAENVAHFLTIAELFGR